MNKAGTLIAIIVGICTMMGTAFTIDGRYAKQGEVKQVKKEIKEVDKRLDKKILKDRADLIQERIWKLEDRYAEKKMPKAVKEAIRDLKKEYDDIIEKHYSNVAQEQGISSKSTMLDEITRDLETKAISKLKRIFNGG